MGCSACAKRKAKSTRYEVVASNGTVVFSSSSKPTAEYYAKRYKGAKVQEVAPDGTKKPVTAKRLAS